MVPEKPVAAKVVIKFLFLILQLKNFTFNGIHYLQKLRCAMGAVCIPNYENIFMGKFKRNFIYPCLQTFSIFCRKFVADIFLLWNGSETIIIRSHLQIIKF